MGFETDIRYSQHRLTDQEFAAEQFHKNQKNIEQVLRSLPTNRELLTKICEYGLQPI
jgi:hypothetical protein